MSTTTKGTHTPGPWRIDRPLGYWAIGPNPHADDGQVLRLYTKPYGEDEANARLIAASPDLLAACKELASRFEKTGEAWMSDPAWQAARAAIAKAEGGAA